MIIGVDPGLTGAIAFINNNGEFISVEDIPVMANGKGKAKVKMQVNPSEIKRMLTGMTINRIYMERTSSMPGQGSASMYSMGDTFGSLRTVFAMLQMPVDIITPQEWKKHYKIGSDKEVARAKAIELFPAAPLGRKKDHNRAEALLIANYGLGLRA